VKRTIIIIESPIITCKEKKEVKERKFTEENSIKIKTNKHDKQAPCQCSSNKKTMSYNSIYHNGTTYYYQDTDNTTIRMINVLYGII